MTWHRRRSPQELYQEHVRNAADRLRTSDSAALETWQKDLKARLRQLAAGADANPTFIDEEHEVRRLLQQIQQRLAYLGRVAAGGDDGRDMAEKGTSVFHRMLREAFAERDRIEAVGGDTSEVQAKIRRLREQADVLAPLPGADVAPSEELVAMKRAEPRYAGAM